MYSPKNVRHDSVTPCEAFCFETWIVGGYLMIFAGSLNVCCGYQNCSPRNCVAPSTVMNGADSSSIRKTLPTGCCFSGCRVPRPTGPCTPMIDTFIFSVIPPATGYGSSL